MDDKILVDVDKLREALVDDTGSAVFAGSLWAIADVTELEDADLRDLIREAEERGWDLRRFEA